MNVESINPTRDDYLADAAPSLPARRLLSPGWLFASLQAAHRIERQARRLYAMSDAQLAARGMTRDGIREQLLQELPD